MTKICHMRRIKMKWSNWIELLASFSTLLNDNDERDAYDSKQPVSMRWRINIAYKIIVCAQENSKFFEKKFGSFQHSRDLFTKAKSQLRRSQQTWKPYKEVKCGNQPKFWQFFANHFMFWTCFCVCNQFLMFGSSCAFQRLVYFNWIYFVSARCKDCVNRACTMKMTKFICKPSVADAQHANDIASVGKRQKFAIFMHCKRVCQLIDLIRVFKMMWMPLNRWCIAGFFVFSWVFFPLERHRGEILE